MLAAAANLLTSSFPKDFGLVNRGYFQERNPCVCSGGEGSAKMFHLQKDTVAVTSLRNTFNKLAVHTVPHRIVSFRDVRPRSVGLHSSAEI